MVPVRKALASRCAQSLGARSRVMGVLASTDWERSVSAIFSAEIRFNRGDWAKLIDKASRRAPSNAASPVEFAKSPMSSVSLSVSLRSEEHTSELQSRLHLVCRLLLEKKKKYRRTLLHNNKLRDYNSYYDHSYTNNLLTNYAIVTYFADLFLLTVYRRQHHWCSNTYSI